MLDSSISICELGQWMKYTMVLRLLPEQNVVVGERMCYSHRQCHITVYSNVSDNQNSGLSMFNVAERLHLSTAVHLWSRYVQNTE